MIKNHGSVSIDVPVEVVFDFLADARNEPRWLPGAANVRPTSAPPIGLGSTFTGEYARAGTIRIELTRYERPSRISLTALEGRCTSRTRSN